MISIGHDIVEIERIQLAFQKYGEKFLQKIFTSEERNYCLQKKNPFPSLAVRFAAKEAVSKAFMCGIGEQFSWKSASVVNHPNGYPEIKLDSLGIKLIKSLGGSKIILSLTHTHNIASAVVLIF